MGATDFDRRIQLIRAISGELSRTIRRIEGIADARVQIVLPETKLFEAVTAPATAAVLLRLTPGARIRSEQVNGIIYLVASSVENLKPENITVVDEFGNILSNKGITAQFPQQRVSEVLPPKNVESNPEQQIIKKEVPAPSVEAAKIEEPKKVPVLSPEEKALLQIKAREEFERLLASKTQDLLNQFYPLNSVIVRINAELGPAKQGDTTKIKVKTDSTYFVQAVKKIYVIVLIDEKVPFNSKVKDNTYQTICAAIDYKKGRGDKIVLKRVPFREAIAAPVMPLSPPPSKFSMPIFPMYVYLGGAVVGVVFLFMGVMLYFRKGEEVPFTIGSSANEGLERVVPSEEEALGTIGDIKNMATKDPAKLANLIKKWLTEE